MDRKADNTYVSPEIDNKSPKQTNKIEKQNGI